jgi:hypothetical protein
MISTIGVVFALRGILITVAAVPPQIARARGIANEVHTGAMHAVVALEASAAPVVADAVLGHTRLVWDPRFTLIDVNGALGGDDRHICFGPTSVAVACVRTFCVLAISIAAISWVWCALVDVNFTPVACESSVTGAEESTNEVVASASSVAKFWVSAFVDITTHTRRYTVLVFISFCAVTHVAINAICASGPIDKTTNVGNTVICVDCAVYAFESSFA